MIGQQMYTIILDEEVIKQLKKIKDKKLQLKIKSILKELELDPYNSNNKFERLKHNFKGYCSKRLNKKDRIIYKVDDKQIIVLVISVLGHYE